MYMDIVSLKKYQKEAPNLPGVYSFKDKYNNSLYIGKAKSLQKRLYSHIISPSTSGGKKLLKQTDNIEWIVCQDEWEALNLEQSMIKKQKPKFNVKLRSGKKYPYIAISFDEEYPRVYLTRETRVKGRKYFGPYETKKALQLLDILGRIFQYRTCSGKTPGRHSGSPCLDYSIKRCTAPCVDYISQKEYAESISKIEQFLLGKWRKTLEELASKMKEASQKQDFEQAVIFRDRLQLLEKIVNTNSIKGLSASDNYDVIGSFQVNNTVKIHTFRIREGYIQESQQFNLECLEQDCSEAVNKFLLQYYDFGNTADIIFVENNYNLTEVSKFLSQKNNKKITVKISDNSQVQNIIKMAKRNAAISLKKDLLKQQIDLEELKPDLHSAVVDLAGYLDIDHNIKRIECYDISNIGPKHTVGSMVVFEGEMKKEDYRRFKINNTIQDDFKSMQQMLERRVKAFYNKKDNSFSSLPDLIIIDGGKGQLSAGIEALKDFKKLGVKIISLAKKEEEIFIEKQSQPIVIQKHEPASLLIQQIRNEAHRFAVTYHRLRRDKDMVKSSLDSIEGIGKARKAKLLQTFGSPQAVQKASQEELATVVSEKLAQKIYDHFH